MLSTGKKDLISVIIPSYNRAHFLKRAVKSVLEQTYPHFELIIINDGSRDNTVEVVTAFKDKRINLINLSPHEGSQLTRNVGLKAAQGIYIAFLDDDDTWNEEKLEKEYYKLHDSSPKTGLVYSGSRVMDRRQRTIIQTNIPGYIKNPEREFLIRPVISSISCALIRKECFDTVGLLDEKFEIYQDWDIWKRITTQYDLQFIPEVLTTIYTHDQQLSANFEILIQDRKQFLKKYAPELQQFPELNIIHQKTLGQLYGIHGSWKEAWRYFHQINRQHPLEFFKLIHWLCFEYPWAKKRAHFCKPRKSEKKRALKKGMPLSWWPHVPLVSVIIPTHNRASMLKKTLQSTLDQTYEQLEIIVVDDASTDETPEIIRSFQDSRIHYLRHEQNQGAPAARNTGLRHATGSYIALLDDDDEWESDKILMTLKKFNDVDDKVGVIYCGSVIVERRGQQIIKRCPPEYKGDLIQPLRLGPTVCGLSSTLIRKECFDQVGLFDEELKSCQDWDLWKRIAQHYHFDYVADFLAVVNFHNKQISNTLEAVIKGREQILEKYKDEYRQYPQDLIIHYKTLGKLYSIKNDWGQAAHYFLQAIRMNFAEIFKIIGWYMLEYHKVKKREYIKMPD